MRKLTLNSTLKDIKEKIFYRNGLLIAVALLLVFIYRMTVINPYSIEIMFITIPSIVVLVLLFYNPKLCVILITVWIPFRNLLVGGVGSSYIGYEVFAILPEPMKYLDTYLLLILTARWLSKKIFYREAFIRTQIDLPVIIFCSLALISAVGNLTSPIIAFAGVRTFLQFGLFYYAIIQLGFEEKFLKKMVILYIILAMVQTPISVYNFLTLKGDENVSLGDATIGTFKGGSNLLAHYEGMMMCIILGLIKFNPKKIFKYILLFVWFMISFFTASGKAAIFLFPVAALFVISQGLKQIMDFVKSYFIYFLILIFVAAFFFLSGISDRYYGKKLEIMSPSRIYEQFMITDEGWEGRGFGYKAAWEALSEEPLDFLYGVGPGMFLSNTGAYFQVPLYNKYNLQSLKYGYREDNSRVFPPDIPVLLGEFGFLGLFAFGFILFRLYQNFKDGIKSLEDPFWKGISAGAFGVLILIVLVAIGERSFEIIYLQYLLWFFASIIYKMRLIKQKADSAEK